jgi:hypothetical protein
MGTSFVTMPSFFRCRPVAVVQQRLSDQTRTARRYHWLSESVTSVVNEPLEAICADRTAPTLQMPKRHTLELQDVDPLHLHSVLLATYDRRPENFEVLLGLQGVGAKTLRALALVSEPA